MITRRGHQRLLHSLEVSKRDGQSSHLDQLLRGANFVVVQVDPGI